jgi:hypothetical protein
MQWRASKLHPARYGGSSSTLSVETNVAVGGDAELAAARAHLVSELDAIAERLEAADRSDFWVSRIVNDAVRAVEAKRRLDPLNEDDQALIIATVTRALAPNGEPLKNGHNDINGLFDDDSPNGEPVPFAAQAAE